MGYILSPFADWTSDRRPFREGAAVPQLVSTQASETNAGDESVGIRPLGAETTGRSAEAADVLPLQKTPEPKPPFAGGDIISKGVPPPEPETQFVGGADGAPPNRVVWT